MRNFNDFQNSFFIEIMRGSNPQRSTFNTDLIHRYNTKYRKPTGSLAHLVEQQTCTLNTVGFSPNRATFLLFPP